MYSFLTDNIIIVIRHDNFFFINTLLKPPFLPSGGFLRPGQVPRRKHLLIFFFALIPPFLYNEKKLWAMEKGGK